MVETVRWYLRFRFANSRRKCDPAAQSSILDQAAAGLGIVAPVCPHGTGAMRPEQQIAALKQLPVLEFLSDETFQHVARSCVWRQFESGAQVLEYGDDSTDVLFLLAGRARATRYSVEGKAVIFADLEAPIMFGEIAAIDRKPRSASVEALAPCTIAFLSARDFESLLEGEPTVAIATLRLLTSYVRGLNERVFEFSAMAVQNRIHAELLRLARKSASKDETIILSPAPSLSEIANRISTHREAVSRELSRLTSVGLLRREHGNLVITDVARLTMLLREAIGE